MDSCAFFYLKNQLLQNLASVSENHHPEGRVNRQSIEPMTPLIRVTEGQITNDITREGDPVGRLPGGHREKVLNHSITHTVR